MMDQELINHAEDNNYIISPEKTKELVENYKKVIEDNAELYKRLTRK